MKSSLEQNRPQGQNKDDSQVVTVRVFKMDGTGEHYAKWNKPDSEGQIPYDLTFNWNIINKRKKQTKYNETLKLRTL